MYGPDRPHPGRTHFLIRVYPRSFAAHYFSLPARATLKAERPDPLINNSLRSAGFCILLAATLPTVAANLTITATGDVRISPRLINRHAPVRLTGDLVFANFEGVLANPADPDPWKFCMPPRTVDLLSAMGITALSLANNHSLDMGRDAYNKTEAALSGRFAVAGIDRKPAILHAVGRRIRLIACSFGAVNDVNHPETVRSFIGPKKDEVVIVSAHMGGENHLAARIPFVMEYFGREQRGNVVEFSHRCIDAGADLVLGHSPHIPRGIELYKNKLIVYSLGNFLFDYPGATLHPHAPGYVISVELDARGDFQSARVASYDLQEGVPVPDPAGQAYKIIRNLTLDNLHATNLSFPGGGIITRCLN
jgi:hypothetical protein